MIDSLISSKYFFEMGACISSSDGNLLLYSNHDSIYNRNQRAVYDSKIPDRNFQYINYSITQGSLILPAPNNDFKYFVLSITGCDMASGNIICYSYNTVDIRLDDGLGGLIEKNVPLDTTLPMLLEKQTAIKHSDGKDWWVVLHESENKNFIKYLLSSKGISGPYLQNFGQDDNTVFGAAALGEMVANEKGTQLVLTGARILSLYDFDRCSGVISNWTPIDTTTWEGWYYGASFSPDGTKLYVTELGNYSGAIVVPSLYQFDLSAPDIAASKTKIFTIPDTNFIAFGQHQIGPDGKIYITTTQGIFDGDSSNFFLSVIDNPNALGAACNFKYLEIPTWGKRLTLNLPNLPNYDLGPINAQTADLGQDTLWTCKGISVSIGYPDTSSGKCVFLWQNANGTSLSTSSQYVFTADTSLMLHYYVTDTTMSSCAVTEDSVYLRVIADNELLSADAGADTVVCKGKAIMLGEAGAGNSDWTNTWTNINNDTLGTSPTLNVNPQQDSEYFLTIVHRSGASCTESRDSVRVFISPACENQNGIAVYPNPAMDEFVIEVLSDGPQQLTIDMYNTLGQRIFEEVSETAGYHATVVDGSVLAEGMYFIRVMRDKTNGGTGSSEVVRVVVGR